VNAQLIEASVTDHLCVNGRDNKRVSYDERCITSGPEKLQAKRVSIFGCSASRKLEEGQAFLLSKSLKQLTCAAESTRILAWSLHKNAHATII
jgi:hypothetical protein